MGEHKRNPVAKLAKEGKLPPKGPKIGYPERRRRLQERIDAILAGRLLMPRQNGREYYRALSETLAEIEKGPENECT